MILNIIVKVIIVVIKNNNNSDCSDTNSNCDDNW
jgi:hypothetical protein